MIVVRNIFRTKFGQAKPVVALWKEGIALMQQAGSKGTARILTDLTGPSYTVVIEISFASLTEFEQTAGGVMSNPEWHAWYQRLIPHIDSAHREILSIVA